jgi:hypothetical protein
VDVGNKDAKRRKNKRRRRDDEKMLTDEPNRYASMEGGRTKSRTDAAVQSSGEAKSPQQHLQEASMPEGDINSKERGQGDASVARPIERTTLSRVAVRLSPVSSDVAIRMQDRGCQPLLTLDVEAKSLLIDILARLRIGWQRAVPAGHEIFVQAQPDSHIALRGLQWKATQCDAELTIGDMAQIIGCENGLLSLLYGWYIRKAAGSDTQTPHIEFSLYSHTQPYGEKVEMRDGIGATCHVEQRGKPSTLAQVPIVQSFQTGLRNLPQCVAGTDGFPSGGYRTDVSQKTPQQSALDVPQVSQKTSLLAMLEESLDVPDPAAAHATAGGSRANDASCALLADKPSENALNAGAAANVSALRENSAKGPEILSSAFAGRNTSIASVPLPSFEQTKASSRAPSRKSKAKPAMGPPPAPKAKHSGSARKAKGNASLPPAVPATAAYEASESVPPITSAPSLPAIVQENTGNGNMGDSFWCYANAGMPVSHQATALQTAQIPSQHQAQAAYAHGQGMPLPAGMQQYLGWHVLIAQQMQSTIQQQQQSRNMLQKASDVDRPRVRDEPNSELPQRVCETDNNLSSIAVPGESTLMGLLRDTTHDAKGGDLQVNELEAKGKGQRDQSRFRTPSKNGGAAADIADDETNELGQNRPRRNDNPMSPPPLPPDFFGNASLAPAEVQAEAAPHLPSDRSLFGESVLPPSLLGFGDLLRKNVALQGLPAALVLQGGAEALFQQVVADVNPSTSKAGMTPCDRGKQVNAQEGAILGEREKPLDGSLGSALEGRSNSSWLAAFEAGQATRRGGADHHQAIGNRPFASLFGDK